MKIAEALIHAVSPLCQETPVADVRIGLGYTVVELADGAAGLAWTPNSRHGGSCTQMRRAGTLDASTELELLGWLTSDNQLERAVGLATCNALNSRKPRTDWLDQEAISLLDIQTSDRVVMVGHFAPLVGRIRERGCQLDILDLDGSKPGLLDPTKGPAALADCEVAIITGTSVVTNTLDELCASLGSVREAVLLGPSTPLCPEVFRDTPITQVSGSRVLEAGMVKRIVSQGGGTMLLKRHLRFSSLKV